MRTNRTRYRAKRSGAGQAAKGACAIILLALAIKFGTEAFRADDRLPLPVRLSLMHELPEFDYSHEEEIPLLSVREPPAADLRTPFEPVGYINGGHEEYEAPPEEYQGAEGLPEELPIKPISIIPASASGYLEAAENVLVKNDTKFDVDVSYLLGRGLPYGLTEKGAQVLIIHTHGSESYTAEGRDTYDPSSETNRSQDVEQNVVRVGREIADIVRGAGIGVIHDTTMYDLTDFNRSYEASLKGIQKHLKENPSIKVVIDVHRDAMITAEGTKYKPVVRAAGADCAQIMLVMGTGQNGLSHEYWKENLKLALRLQRTMNTDYPGLARPINLRNDRFNQHATMGSMLVEVGSSGNTLEEAINGARCFAWSLVKELNKIKKE